MDHPVKCGAESRKSLRVALSEAVSCLGYFPSENKNRMELIDSHAHIDFPQFAEDRDAMLERARAAGVSTLLAIGTGSGPEKLDAAVPYAEQYDWIYTTVGIHPHEAKEVTQQHLGELAPLAKKAKDIAGGGGGLGDLC